MSNYLSAVQEGISRKGIRAVIAGVEKIGKTTLCADAPMPLLLGLEDGYAVTPCAKITTLKSFNSVMEFLSTEVYPSLVARKFPYKTLIFDTVTQFERILHDHVLAEDTSTTKNKTMESAHGGYGKAYLLANQLFCQFLTACDYIAQFEVNIILICHSFSTRVSDPLVGEYDITDLLLHSPKNNKTYGKREILAQWADLIGYLYEPIIVQNDEKSKRAITQNRGRILALNRTPNFVAGNRYGVTKDIPIPLKEGWNHLAQAIYEASGFDYFNRKGK